MEKNFRVFGLGISMVHLKSNISAWLTKTWREVFVNDCALVVHFPIFFLKYCSGEKMWKDCFKNI